MLRHDLAIALRRIARQRLHVALSVTVLTLGIACFLAAFVFVSYLRSYDGNFANVSRTYLISQSVQPRAGNATPFLNNSAYPLADHLRADFEDLAAVARYCLHQVYVVAGTDTSQRRVSYAEPAFLEIFDFVPLAGDLRSALTEPRSVVLTEDTARTLFGAAGAVGKTLTINGKQAVDVTVRAVIAELPKSSHLARDNLFAMGFEILASWDLFDLLERMPYFDSWGNMPLTTYVLTPSDGSIPVAELDRRLALVAERSTAPPAQGFKVALRARPIPQVATTQMQNAFQGFSGTAWGVDIFDTLLSFAAAILAIACVNFVNLATAQSSGRTLDIGTRKALGATAAQIVRQDLLQTALTVAAAIVLALAALAPLTHAATGPYRLALAVPWGEPRLWVFLAAVLVGVTIAAGAYPALVLARIRPVAALRIGAGGTSSRGLRTVLVGVQFATASLLVTLVIVLTQQSDALRAAVLGRFADQYVGLFVNPQNAALSVDALATEIARNPVVHGVTRTNIPPWFGGNPAQRSFGRSADEEAPNARVEDVYIAHDYFAVMNLAVVAGRVFSRERADDALPTSAEEYKARLGKPISIVLDRAAARALGWPNPSEAVGEVISPAGGSVPQYEVIGVVESVVLSLRDRGSAGVAYSLLPTAANFVLVRFDKDGTTSVLAAVDATIKKLAPGRTPPQRVFLDEMFENAYWTFRITNRVLTGLALLAIAIAGIGLFGMASYVTSKRTREIGLRKSQGASPAQIVRLLLWDFAKPIVVANLIAWPLAYYAAERYLGIFSRRITLTPLPFVAALAATLLLACATVAVQALRASRVRPTEALRHD
jgi:putative ABC transport system permease protein